MNRFPKSSINVALELGNLVNVSELVVVRADVPVPPLGIGDMFACQGNPLSILLIYLVRKFYCTIQDSL